ncbi:MAG: type I 3-dehydroquinate dehydratase [Desulfobacterales bacterium]|nr:type I 3-dehydroquinate dehydratase [Desulfobacterales bacterium]
MRLQSKKPLTIRNKILGGPVPWICLPLVAEDQAALLQQANDVLGYQPDALEWRVDKFEAVRDAGAVLQALNVLREAIGDLPLIFTCRIIAEGGFQEIAEKDRLAVMEAVIASGKADLIDTEISNGKSIIAAVKKACLNTGAGLILSYHNFDETPEESYILEKLIEAAKLDGDVAKVAVMSKNYGDVLTLLSATYRARTELLEIPIITMSMGREGGITRIAGGLFGSDLTFAIGKASSAPGQIPIGEIRKAWGVLPYDDC